MLPGLILVARRALRIVAAAGLATGWAFAASVAIEDLERKAVTADAAEKSAALVQLAHELEPVDVARALDIARQARSAARTPHDQLAADVLIASIVRTRGDYTEAQRLVHDGLAAAAQLGDDGLRAKFLYVSGRTEWSLGDLPASLDAFLECIRLAEKSGDRGLLCDAHAGVASVYNESHQLDRAKDHIQQAMQLAEALGDPTRLGDAYKVYGNFLIAQGDLPAARAAHERSRAIHEQAGNERGVADALQNLASLAETDHDLAAAVRDCTRAVAIYQRLGLKRHLLNAERELGRVLAKQGHTKEGIAHLKTSLTLANELGSGRTAMANAWRELATAYELAGDYRAALDAQRRFQQENDAVFSERSRQQLTSLNARYDAERREHEIDVLRRDQELKAAELERTRWQRWGLAGALVLGLAALGAIISRQRLKLRTDERIIAQTSAAKEAAEEADRVKTRFLGIASHDIRSPLGNIVNLTSILRHDTTDAETRAERLDLINSEAQRVFSLVEDLITIAALETGRLELRPASIDLAAVTREAIATLRWQADAKRQRIDLVPASAEAGWLTGDAARLNQVVANLLSNAIKFSPPGSTITLELARRDATVTLTIRDQGAGISKEDAERLFAPFGRLATHPTAGESSHGLGLSIAQEIVQRHNGRIRVESQPGRGSAFIVELPA